MYTLSSLRFRHKWRTYQERILKELESHLDDEKLHIVAAPGSGKTILGLEVVSRFGKPTLVLTPTLAIRDQWVQRLVEYFLPEGASIPNWISKDIRHPRLFTVATYQALHSAITQEMVEEEDDTSDSDAKDNELNILNVLGEIPSGPALTVKDFVQTLKNAGIETVVLDEAHHLRSAWWKSLTKVIDSLGDVRIISLTATPPYDVPDFEWKRYIDLCGPVDAEIPVPELVMMGDLCPHQDLVVLSTPSKTENNEIKKFREAVKKFVEGLKQNEEFTKHIFSHPWIITPELYEEEILDHPEFYSSMLIFLNDRRYPLTKDAVKIVADSTKNIPKLNLEWLEILLGGLVFPPGESRPHLDFVIEEIKSELKRIGAIERRRVTLRKNKRIEKLLKRSISKLKSVLEIVKVEVDTLGPELRMVILTDYIRRDTLPRRPDELTQLNKMGVCPIFEAIRRENIPGARIGVLSGSLVIIPVSAQDTVRDMAYRVGIDPINLNFGRLSYTDQYVEVIIGGSDRSKIVHLMTEVFNEGAVNVLVGTASLLGEGWDAPSINSLVIASFVGSYMLSNQMRGRAIRTQPGNPNKTSNIWHLVCVESGSDPGQDYELMARRFKAFVGISFVETVIENGFERLGLPKPSISKRAIKASNERMFDRARNREAIRKDWENALHLGEDGVRLVEEIQAEKVLLPRGFVFYNTIAAIFWYGVFLGILAFLQYLRGFRIIFVEGWALTYLIIGMIITLAFSAPFLLKALWLFIRHGPVKSSMKQIGTALLKALYYAGEIQTSLENLGVIVKYDKYTGFVFCHLNGGSNREKWIYLDALKEILGPIENPRYLLVRKSRLLFIQRIDYHTVPTVIGTRKKYAKYFADMWRKYVGKMELVYTRRKEGRAILIRARNHSLSAAFVPRSKKRTQWK